MYHKLQIMYNILDLYKLHVTKIHRKEEIKAIINIKQEYKLNSVNINFKRLKFYFRQTNIFWFISFLTV